MTRHDQQPSRNTPVKEATATIRPYGKLPDGRTVHEYTLRNASNMEVRILDYGGIVTRLYVPDCNGQLDDVVLGYNSLDAYLADHNYFGAIAGRVAGRIRRGEFSLDGMDYTLAINNPPNHLHGGNIGLNRRLWHGKLAPDSQEKPSLRLSYCSPDGEEGYPGTVDLVVTYTLTPACELIIQAEAMTDRSTPLSLTHHGYFNLAGEGTGGIHDHELQIHADAFCPCDEQLTLLGRWDPVAGKSNNFNQPRRLGESMPHLFKTHGDLYRIRRSPQEHGVLAPVAVVFDPQSRRLLTVRSTDECMQFYTGVHLDGTSEGKSGRPYQSHAGFCIECEGYPDGVNPSACGDIVLQPGQTYRQTTIYGFSIR